MKTKIIAAVLVAMAFSGCTAYKGARTHSLEQYLPGIREFLQGFVDSQSENEVDYFLVSPVSHQDAGNFEYAFWMNRNLIIILDLPIGKMESPGYMWSALKGRIDLAKDVVPTLDDVDGSTYLCSLDDVQKMLRDCLGGVKVIVKKKKGADQPYNVLNDTLEGEFQIRHASARPAARAYFLIYAAALDYYATEEHKDVLSSHLTLLRLLQDAKSRALLTFDRYKDMVGNFPPVVDRKQELHDLESFVESGRCSGNLKQKLLAYIEELKK